jgi:spore coat protein CotH
VDKLEKISLIGLLLLALLLSGLLIYFRKELMLPPESKEPFRSDHVAKIRIVMKEDDWQRLKTDTRAEQYVRADFWFDGEPYKNVAIRPKGMSSLMSGRESGRMPLKVDFNFFNFAQNFRGVKKLNLNNGFSDPSFIRETIGYELFEQMNLPTPRRAFADVWVNDTHLGLYTIVEQVDKTFLRRNFANPEGNLYKPETPAAALNWTKEDIVKQGVTTSQTSDNKKQNNLDIKIGGARLGDLVRILKQEGTPGNEMLPEDTSTSSGQGQFPPGGGGQFPGGPRGQFPGDPNRPFPGEFGGMGPGGPGGRFPGDPNMPFPGGFGGMGPGGGFPDDPNRPFPGGPGGRGEQFPDDPNRPFPGGFGGGRRFPGDPNRPFARGRGRGGFGGGPGGPFGRGGNLLEQMGLKTNENSPDYSALFRFLEILNNCPDETFPSEIEKVLDVDGVLRFLAVSVLMVHLDNYIGMGHNYYLYEVDGKFTIIPWDLNMAFGTFGMGPNQGGVGNVDLYIDEPTTGATAGKPLVARLFAHKPYLDKYHQYLEQLLDGGFAEGVIESRIDELAELIRPYVEADDMKFSTNKEFESNVSEASANVAGEFSGERSPDQMQGRGFGGRGGGRRGGFGGGGPGMNAPKLKTFIKARRLSVTEQLNGIRPARSQGDGNTEGNMFDRFGMNGAGPAW